MNDLLKSHIHENCKLALPEGLKDLMSDISREVLRAQPQNLYQFIANYLEAMLEAREMLTIACEVCSDVCNCTCDPIMTELYKELRKIGLDEEDVENAIEVIENHLEGDQKSNHSVKEQSLLIKILKKTSIDETQLPAVQQAVQKAFKRHGLTQGNPMHYIRNKNNKGPSEAVHHTLQLYNQSEPKIQKETKELNDGPNYKPCLVTVSSTSLAGSMVQLPKFRPYSVHDSEILSAITEKEHSSYDYTNIASTTEVRPSKIKISDEKTYLEEADNKRTVLCDTNHKAQNGYYNDEHSSTDCTEATTCIKFKSSKIKISEETINIDETGDTDKGTEISDDYNEGIEEDSADEVAESIENIETENESCASSIAEVLQDEIEQ